MPLDHVMAHFLAKDRIEKMQEAKNATVRNKLESAEVALDEHRDKLCTIENALKGNSGKLDTVLQHANNNSDMLGQHLLFHRFHILFC